MRSDSRDGGYALVLVLAAILVLLLFVLALAAALRDPTRALGETGRAKRELAEAESLLERGRALLVQDPSYDLSQIGIAAAWDPHDSCLVAVTAPAGRLRLTETWVVTAPCRFTLYAQLGMVLLGDSDLGDPVHAGDPAHPFEPVLFDTAPLEPLVQRRISGTEFDSLAILSEVVEITPPSESETVRITNLSIEHGILIVSGDLILAGAFEGKARHGWPLLIVTGSLFGQDHAETWSWEGVVASGGAVSLSGPVEYEGSLVARLAALQGPLSGEVKNENDILGFTPRIRTIGRREEY